MNRGVIRRTAWCAVAVLTACAVGPKISNFWLASSPEGTPVTVLLNDSEFRSAELLEMADSSVLLLTRERELVRVYYSRIRVFRPQHGPSFHGADPMRPMRLAQLRALARYPQGLTPGQVDTLLATYAQSRVEVHR